MLVWDSSSFPPFRYQNFRFRIWGSLQCPFNYNPVPFFLAEVVLPPRKGSPSSLLQKIRVLCSPRAARLLIPKKYSPCMRHVNVCWSRSSGQGATIPRSPQTEVQTGEVAGTGLWLGLPRREPDMTLESSIPFSTSKPHMSSKEWQNILWTKQGLRTAWCCGHYCVFLGCEQRTENPHICAFKRTQLCIFLLITAGTYLLLTVFLCRVGNADYGQGNAQGIWGKRCVHREW